MNTSASLAAELAEQRVLGWQAKLHRWAGEDEHKRFDDVFNLVCEPATLLVWVGAGEAQPRVTDPRC